MSRSAVEFTKFIKKFSRNEVSGIVRSMIKEFKINGVIRDEVEEDFHDALM